MNAIVQARILSQSSSIIGKYDAGDLQRAMRRSLAKKANRTYAQRIIENIEARFPLGCDVKPDGSIVSL